METKTIDKLEELKGYEWEYHGKKFLLTGQDYLVLKQTDTFDNEGLLCCISLRFIGLENLTELEFYGLKVILNEKPKVTVEEKAFLEKEMYVAREQNGMLYAYFGKPTQKKVRDRWELWESDASDCIQIDKNLFPFITWESGKAWSKSELMELEVVE